MGEGIEILKSEFWASLTRVGVAQKKLLELVRQHPDLEINDPLWFRSPADNAGPKEVQLSREDAEAFSRMSEAEKLAWFDKRLAEVDEARKRRAAELPGEIRAHLARVNELRDLHETLARKLATRMYNRGLVGLIADTLLLQYDEEVHEYLDIPENE